MLPESKGAAAPAAGLVLNWGEIILANAVSRVAFFTGSLAFAWGEALYSVLTCFVKNKKQELCQSRPLFIIQYLAVIIGRVVLQIAG